MASWPTARVKAGRKPAPKPKPITSPPPGSYDPAIDAQVGQVNRGLADLLNDYVRDYGEPGTALGGRMGEDYGLGVQGVERDYGRGVQDVELGYSRNVADLLRSRGRAGEDYGQSIAGLERNFAQLGSAQTQTARAAGVQRGGALAQALAKRAANKAIARQPIDTSFARFNEDSALTEGRLGEDRGLNLGRLGENRGVALGGLQTSLLRGTEDAATQLARAQRENAQFGLDATTQKFFQANMPLNPAAKKKKPVPRPYGSR